jgi:hypothetical protein
MARAIVCIMAAGFRSTAYLMLMLPGLLAANAIMGIGPASAQPHEAPSAPPSGAGWPAPAGSLDELLPPDVLQSWTAGGELRRTFTNGDTLALFPRLSMRDREIDVATALRATVGVEFLVTCRPADSMVEETWQLEIFNALHALSRLKGIQYYSVSRGRLTVLFSDASFVESVGSLTRIDDPVALLPPGEGMTDTRFAVLDDASLGTYVMRIRYEVGSSYVAASMDNETSIRRFGMQLVPVGQLRMFIVVVPLDDELLFYGYAAIRAQDKIGLVTRLAEDAVTNRLAALYAWFRSTRDCR